jgi:hypothetical protein
MNGVPVSKTTIAPLVSLEPPLGFLKGVWRRWKQIAKAVGVVQTRILMVGLYFVFVVPLGLVARWSGDPLHLRARSGSNWVPHQDRPPSIESARQQF